jgi:serine O-acetyltransferase
LGGDTSVGERSVVGGSVFLTRSVPRDSRVAVKAPELRVVQNGSGSPDPNVDFEI